MPVKKTNEQTLGDAIREMIATYRIGRKLSEAKVIAAWEKIVGQMIASHTTEIRIYNRKLFIKLDSAALRNELFYAREKIKKMMNDEAGEELIDEVVL